RLAGPGAAPPGPRPRPPPELHPPPPPTPGAARKPCRAPGRVGDSLLTWKKGPVLKILGALTNKSVWAAVVGGCSRFRRPPHALTSPPSRPVPCRVLRGRHGRCPVLAGRPFQTARPGDRRRAVHRLRRRPVGPRRPGVDRYRRGHRRP